MAQLVDHNRGEAREYRSVDAAAEAAKSLGHGNFSLYNEDGKKVNENTNEDADGKRVPDDAVADAIRQGEQLLEALEVTQGQLRQVERELVAKNGAIVTLSDQVNALATRLSALEKNAAADVGKKIEAIDGRVTALETAATDDNKGRGALKNR